MKIELSPKAAEIINYMSELHYTDPQFLIEQMLIQEIECLLSNTKYFSPKKRGTLFEEHEYPCAFDITIDDCYKEFKEIEDALEVAFRIKANGKVTMFREILSDKLSMDLAA